MVLPLAYPGSLGNGDLLANGSVPLTGTWDIGDFRITNISLLAVGLVTPLAVIHARGAAAMQIDNGATDGFTFAQSAAKSWAWTALSAGSIMSLQNSTLGIGTTTPAATLDVNQTSATGATPVLRLNQVDVSEEMMSLITTHGVGNAIEDVGAKTLTVTEFVKVTTSNGTRYLQAGTIA